MRKKGESSCGIAERGAYIGDAVVDLLPHFLARQFLHARRMILGVRADGMPFLVDPADPCGIGPRHLADQEIRGLHALRGENVEDLVGIARQRTVVEGQHHFFVGERQRLPVLHQADLRQLAGFENQHAAGAECVGIPGAFLRLRRRRGNQRAGQADGRAKRNTRNESNRRPKSRMPLLGTRAVIGRDRPLSLTLGKRGLMQH